MEKIGISISDLGWSLNETQWIFSNYASSSEKATYDKMLFSKDITIAKSAETYRENIALKYYDQAKKDYQEKLEKRKEEEKKNQEKQVEEQNKAQDSEQQSFKVITQEDYDKLPEEEKPQWVLITETSSYKKFVNKLSCMGDASDIINKIQPLQPIYKMIPASPPGEQLSKTFDSLEKMFKTLDPIKAVESAPFVGILVKPLVDFINALFKVIGMAFMLILMIEKGQKFFSDDLCNAVDQIDWDGLADAVKKYNEKMSNANKNNQVTIDAEIVDGTNADVKRKMYNTAEADKNKIPNDSKKTIEEADKELDKLQNTIQTANTAAKGVKTYKETVAIQYSSEAQIEKAIEVMEKIGIDFSPLLHPDENEEKKMDEMFPDPMKQVKKINSLVKKLNKPEKKRYAKIEEKNVVKEEIKLRSPEPPPSADLKEKVSTNYCVGDLCYSWRAKSAKIDNTPPKYVVENLRLVSENILEKVRVKFPDVQINCGYRCEELNEYLKTLKMGAADTSQHRTGEAIDMSFTRSKPYDVAAWIRDNLKFDQLILEYNTSGDVWVHCSYSKNVNHGTVMTYKGKKPYIPGLQHFK